MLSYWALFWICFLAATILPMGSEPAVGAMAAMQKHIWGVLTIASVGNYLGALTNYAGGRWGGNWILKRFLGMTSQNMERAEKRFSRWGTPVLFFAWMPIIGDPLTVLAGILKIHPLIFTLWVLPGKTLRYYLIIKGVEQWQGLNPGGFFS